MTAYLELIEWADERDRTLRQVSLLGRQTPKKHMQLLEARKFADVATALRALESQSKDKEEGE